MNRFRRLLRRPFFIRLLNWEYWSFSAVYALTYPVWIGLSARAGSFFFFSAANPSIRNGGFLGESKKDIHDILPSHLYPPTIHFRAGESCRTILDRLKESGMTFPLIGKPDMGGRGRGVKVLRSNDEVCAYTQNCEVDFHIQQFISYPHEVGIFYYRYPGSSKGKISGIVSKEFMSVEGDGVHSIRQILEADNRALLYMRQLETMYGSYLDTVLTEGEKKVMVPYGNHARGSKFLDHSHLADEKLRAFIDEVCKQISGFHFGRLDIRYQSWAELREGKNFSIIEVNGAGSEPTHMYDPQHSIFFAWKEIIRHWYILWKISTMNRRLGHRYLSVKEGLSMLREDKENSKKIERMPV